MGEGQKGIGRMSQCAGMQEEKKGTEAVTVHWVVPETQGASNIAFRRIFKSTHSDGLPALLPTSSAASSGGGGGEE